MDKYKDNVSMEIEVTFSLPVEIADKAREAGLLDSSHFLAYLETELKRKAARADLKAIVETLRANPPLLTEEEIEAELALAKEERIAAATQKSVK
jgi:hypothetical protein